MKNKFKIFINNTIDNLITFGASLISLLALIEMVIWMGMPLKMPNVTMPVTWVKE